MSDIEFSQLKIDESKAYADYSAADETRRRAGEKWLPLIQQLKREELRREIQAESTKAP